MKKLFTIILCFGISGCVYQSANNADLQKALSICKTIDNIEYVSVWFTGAEEVKCLSAKNEVTLSTVEPEHAQRWIPVAPKPELPETPPN